MSRKRITAVEIIIFLGKTTIGLVFSFALKIFAYINNAKHDILCIQLFPHLEAFSGTGIISSK